MIKTLQVDRVVKFMNTVGSKFQSAITDSESENTIQLNLLLEKTSLHTEEARKTSFTAHSS